MFYTLMSMHVFYYVNLYYLCKYSIVFALLKLITIKIVYLKNLILEIGIFDIFLN